MQKIASTLAVLASLAAAAPVRAAESTGAPRGDPMATWKPPTVTRAAERKKEIAALWNAMHDAQRKGDVNAAADLVDYPVLMITDDSKGNAMGEPWARERWIQVMEPFYRHPNPNMHTKHKTTVFLLSNSLASVEDVVTVKMGAKIFTVRSGNMVIKKGGKWLFKAMAEGGWGDMMPSGSPTAGATR